MRKDTYHKITQLKKGKVDAVIDSTKVTVYPTCEGKGTVKWGLSNYYLANVRE